MTVTARYDVSAIPAVPHEFSADVRVFDPRPECEGFVSLTLEIAGAKIRLLLPSHSYGAARSIADLWPTLADRTRPAGGNGVRLSEEALALVGGPDPASDIVPPFSPEALSLFRQPEPEIAEIGDDGA